MLYRGLLLLFRLLITYYGFWLVSHPRLFVMIAKLLKPTALDILW